MKEFIEKLIGRLEEYQGKIKLHFGNRGDFDFMEVDAVKEIVNELAEKYINTSTDTSTTNADRIRSMNDEELAEITLDYDAEYGRYWCSDGTIFEDYEYKEALKHEIEWLQSEVEGVTGNE